ncbi:hypothetical protein G6F60_014372 [Rhizopus arrhizus]|nr:hypothetical protein G6F60_014372 [Rhizopus arrhizus]
MGAELRPAGPPRVRFPARRDPNRFAGGPGHLAGGDALDPGDPLARSGRSLRRVLRRHVAGRRALRVGRRPRLQSAHVHRPSLLRPVAVAPACRVAGRLGGTGPPGLRRPRHAHRDAASDPGLPGAGGGAAGRHAGLRHARPPAGPGQGGAGPLRRVQPPTHPVGRPARYARRPSGRA